MHVERVYLLLYDCSLSLAAGMREILFWIVSLVVSYCLFFSQQYLNVVYTRLCFLCHVLHKGAFSSERNNKPSDPGVVGFIGPKKK